jgi:hypothetical protein
MQKMNNLLGGTGGGSGGGGGGGGSGAGKGIDFSREGVGYSELLKRKSRQLLRDNPFDQKQVNVKSKETAHALQSEEEEINNFYAQSGQTNSAQHREALRKARMGARSQIDDFSQQMRESRANYSLNAVARVGELELGMSQLNAQINIAEGNAKAHLMAQRASAASSRAMAKMAQKLGGRMSFGIVLPQKGHVILKITGEARTLL